MVKEGYLLNPWTNVYGLSRSCLAFGLLITLCFTGCDNLFPTVDGNLIKRVVFDFEKISIYHILSGNLFFAWLISIAVLLFVISGFLPQISGILHWWVAYSYMVSGVIIEGGDQISAILTLFMIPVTVTDNRLNHWYRARYCDRRRFKLAVWSVYAVMTLQVSIIYFHAGVAKLNVQEWVNGTAVYYWFTHDVFGVPDNLRIFVAHILSDTFAVTTVTWGTIVLEILLFGWIFMKRNKWNWKVLFVLGFVFHLSIALVHGLISFMYAMLGALVIYLFPKNIDLNFKIWNRF